MKSLCATIGLLATGLLALGGCTTSRAVLAWRQGWQAEENGNHQAALREYADATSRNGKLAGAALNRVRLIALQPDRREEATLLLDKTLKSNAGEPEVAAFAAQWALWLGDVKLARQRIDAARVPGADTPADVVAALEDSRRAVLAAESRWAEAAKCTTTQGGSPVLRAVVAWNAGDVATAAAATAQAPQGKHRALLEAVLARDRGDWPAATAALAGLDAADSDVLVLTLRGEAAVQLGRADQALQAAGEAAQRAPADARATEVWAVAQLVAGQAAAARDLLAALTVRGAGWSAWQNLGIAHLKLGDLPAAASAFAQAAQRCPTCEPALHNRAALQRMGF